MGSNVRWGSTANGDSCASELSNSHVFCRCLPGTTSLRSGARVRAGAGYGLQTARLIRTRTGGVSAPQVRRGASVRPPLTMGHGGGSWLSPRVTSNGSECSAAFVPLGVSASARSTPSRRTRHSAVDAASRGDTPGSGFMCRDGRDTPQRCSGRPLRVAYQWTLSPGSGQPACRKGAAQSSEALGPAVATTSQSCPSVLRIATQ